MNKIKITFEQIIQCPWCKKDVTVKNERKTLKEATKGEYEDTLKVEKYEQTKLTG